MKNNKLSKQIIIFFIITTISNALLVLGWLVIKITPILDKLDDFKDSAYKELNQEYKSIEELIANLDKISTEKNIVYTLEDSNKNMLVEKEKGLVFFSGFTKIGDETYYINFVSPNRININKLIKENCIFQIVTVSIISIITYLLGRQKIIKPTEIIIEDIKNYKFGKKPEQKNFKGELGLIQNEFVNLTEKLEEEKKEQNRIIASISHDIKTPLTSIIGYADLITEENDVKTIKKYNNKITEKALHLKNVLSSFDDYLVNYEKAPLKLTKISIKDLIKELNNDYKIELENNNIDFTITTNLNNEEIEVDILKLKRIFSNLISNSTRYISTNGKIVIEITKNIDNYIFIISDNGKGVDENILNKIFNPFYTTDKSRKISGLGLSICKEFVEMHGGTIEAYNHKGFVIKFTIPIKSHSNE